MLVGHVDAVARPEPCLTGLLECSHDGDAERHVGLMSLPIEFQERVDRDAAAASIAHAVGDALTLVIKIRAVMERIDEAQPGELVVIDAEHASFVSTWTFVRRRYAEEAGKGRRSLFGEG